MLIILAVLAYLLACGKGVGCVRWWNERMSMQRKLKLYKDQIIEHQVTLTRFRVDSRQGPNQSSLQH